MGGRVGCRPQKALSLLSSSLDKQRNQTVDQPKERESEGEGGKSEGKQEVETEVKRERERKRVFASTITATAITLGFLLRAVTGLFRII